jgi:hypothetical protein
MNQKDLIYLIGIVALAAFAFYIIFGVLKVSGMGLSGLGNNVVEGMTDKQEKRFEKQLEKANEAIEKNMEKLSDSDIAKNLLNQDDVEGFSDYQENIGEVLNLYCEVQKNMLIRDLIEKSSRGKNVVNSGFDKQSKEKMDDIIRFSQFKRFLEEHENVSV